MSRAYRKKNPKAKMVNARTTKAMREACKRPGRTDEHGSPLYFTEQVHKNQCDVNHIIRKHDTGGIILHVSKMEHQYGDMTANDFAAMQQIVLQAKSSFEALPSKIRNEFKNSPELFLKFMEDPANRDRAIELGMIDPDWTEETDGIGEHIKSDEERKKKSDEETPVP